MNSRKKGILVMTIQLALLACVAGVSGYRFSQLPRVWVKVKNLSSDGERALNLRVCPETWPAGSLQNVPVRLFVDSGHLLSEAGIPENRVRLSRESGRVCLVPPLGYVLPEAAAPSFSGQEFWAQLLVPNDELPHVLRISIDKPQ